MVHRVSGREMEDSLTQKSSGFQAWDRNPGTVMKSQQGLEHYASFRRRK